METKGKLTNLQVELLEMFQYDLSEDQLEEVRELLTQYFAEKATNEMDRLWEERNWNEDTMHQWTNEHLRKKSEE